MGPPPNQRAAKVTPERESAGAPAVSRCILQAIVGEISLEEAEALVDESTGFRLR